MKSRGSHDSETVHISNTYFFKGFKLKSPLFLLTNYSQTCPERPPMGPENPGRYRQVAAMDRFDCTDMGKV